MDLEKKITLKIKPIVDQEKSVNIDVFPSEYISSIKGKIQDRFGSPVHFQILSIDNEILENDSVISTFQKGNQPIEITLSYSLDGGCGHKICGCYWVFFYFFVWIIHFPKSGGNIFF